MRRLMITFVQLVLVLSWGSPRLFSQTPLEKLEQRLMELQQQITQLQEEITLLKQQNPSLPVESPVPAPPNPPSHPTIQVGERGLSVRSPDERFQLRLRGVFHTDNRTYVDDAGLGALNTFQVRRMRPIVEFKAFRDFDFRLMPEFAGANATLVDAYLNWRITDGIQIRAGKTKSPTGLERLQSASALTFVERGLPTGLVPNRDIGVELHGVLAKDRIEYSLGLFNGTPDGGTSVVDDDDGKDIAARVFAYPFASDTGSGEGLGIGLAATYGNHSGSPSAYRTTGLQTAFKFNSGTVNDGILWRLAPQATWYRGPVGVLAEWTTSSQRLRRGLSRGEIRNHAWQLQAGLTLTGEDQSFRGIRPRSNLSPAEGQWGAFELVGRIGRLQIDQDAFSHFADHQRNAESILNLGAGLNWFINPNIKVSLDYEANRLSMRPTTVTEHTLFNRLQLAF